MNIDPVLAQFIITAIVAVPVYFKMRSEWRKATAEADSSSVKDALELKREYKADMAALEVKHDALLVKFDKLQKDSKEEQEARATDKVLHDALLVKFDQLQADFKKEQEARAADKILADAEVAKFRLELQRERNARIEDAKRISALEDELDKSYKRIKELEAGSETKRGGLLK